MSTVRTSYTWKIDFGRVRGQTVLVETMDGTRRRGEFTGIEEKSISLFGREVGLPVAVILNDDEQDTIPFDWIRRLEPVEE
jgi:hypothetical protein